MRRSPWDLLSYIFRESGTEIPEHESSRCSGLTSTHHFLPIMRLSSVCLHLNLHDVECDINRPLNLVINIIFIVMGQGISGSIRDYHILTTGNTNLIEESLIQTIYCRVPERLLIGSK